MTLKHRDYFLDELLLFKDTDSIKIVTGIRRCGKSKLLDLMIEKLKEQGIKEERILKMNFESLKFNTMSYREVYQYVVSHTVKDQKNYLFFDEPQMVDRWEKAVNSIRADLSADIYITGSNSHMLSSEFSTLLSGRYVEIPILPLSFREFLDFRDVQSAKEKSPAGGTLWRCYGRDGKEYRPEDLFSAYLKYGGMPGLSELELSEETASLYLESIYNTVVSNDILQREERKGTTKISDPLLLRKLSVFLADNMGKEYSYNRITGAINENMKLSRMDTLGNHKVQDYIEGLKEAFVFYEANRFDCKGKQLLKTNGKFYIVDLGLRNCLLGYPSYDTGFALENLVYFELLRRGYRVSIGKIGTLEIDFRAEKNGSVSYFQVTQSLNDEKTREREIRPFYALDDHYARYVLTTDRGQSDIEGIRVINLIDWLLDGIPS
jgi:predicted AAA+ superfamily ATPase